MFNLAIIIGIYSYIIFFLGVTKLLFNEIIFLVTIVFAVISIITHKSNIVKSFISLRNELKLIGKNTLAIYLLILFLLQILINLIGALGPELAFDALWYHLTLPKIYLEQHSIFYIPGGLLYYSVMPKLGEMLYVGALTFGNEINAKILHLMFGVLSSVALYKLSRLYLTHLLSIVTIVIFYSNLVVAWESTTAYIDLIRTFFEILAVWALVLWWRTQHVRWIVMTAIMIGIAITTKLLAIGSLIIISSLIIYKLFKDKASNKQSLIRFLQFIGIALIIPLPWFIFAFIHTGNPVYPFFTSTYSIDPSTPNPLLFINDIINVLLFSADPISPIYLIFIPLIAITFFKLRGEEKMLLVYTLLSLIMWYFTPRTGGGRFLMPYLPVFSLVCAIVFNYLIKQKTKLNGLFYKWIIVIIILIAMTTIVYRGAANWKYVPVILGTQNTEAFFNTNLNYHFGDFYDADGFFKKTISDKDTVLLYGFHNLYYVDFPYIHSSWIKSGDQFNYIAVHDSELPQRFSNWEKVYENNITKVKLYSDRGKLWSY